MTESIVPLGRRSRSLAIVAGIIAALPVASAGVSAAAVRYDERTRSVVLPGVSVGGVAIGGMQFEVARQNLLRTHEVPLDREIKIYAGEASLTFTPRDLGVTTDALDRFAEIAQHQQSMPPWRRVWLRVLGKPMARHLPVRTDIGQKVLDEFIERVSLQVERTPRDVAIQLVDGQLRIVPEQYGYALDKEFARDQMRSAILNGARAIRLRGETTIPSLGRAQINNVLVIKVGENKLLHYRGEELVKVYDVATGLPRYPTPKGQFKIINKRRNPTWVNPAKYPGGWGWTLPARIGPGTKNPLGTRALDLSVPGIRIHGTSANYSIGYNASHGCIRMRIPDVEELFELVDVGTPVLIVQSGANRSIPAKARQASQLADPEPAAENSASEVPAEQPPGNPLPL